MTSYPFAYWAAWANAAIGGICGVLAAAYLTVHPSWLTGDVAATCGIIVPICGVLAALLPQVTRTPASREAKYIAALAGSLPDDVARKHGLSVLPKPDGSLTVVSPDQPPPS